jgi:hypothetical protein
MRAGPLRGPSLICYRLVPARQVGLATLVTRSQRGPSVSKRSRMFENLPDQKRIALAKAKMEKVLDHFLNLLALHENNAMVVFSPVLASQIPRSYAANAFNVFQHVMHDFELIRLCALWDSAKDDKESIPTVVQLIDHAPIIDALAEETRSHWVNIGSHHLNPSSDPERRALEEEAIKKSNARFGDQQASNAKAELREAIASARSILSSPRLTALRNHRDKHLAHSLTSTRREKDGPIAPVKYGYETELLDASILIVEKLFCWVNGKSFSIEESRRIDRDCAEALWKGCHFKVER